MTTNSELERLFLENDIPRRLLYPLLYRLNHKVGLRHRPPVLLSLAEYYLYTIPGLILVLGAGALIHYWLAGEPLSNMMPPLVAFLVAPLVGWLRYWFIRRRIGLAGSAQSGD
ncbi:MAG: hypothetical protein U5Q16_07400 [Gammaproteobacteria bacterium]|nr:hypothetical protein [Gammaproteobacteria bacterium]